MQATLSLSRRPTPPSTSNMNRQDFIDAVHQVKEYIQAGDIFQLVLSHRFKRRTFADPFEVYRSVASRTKTQDMYLYIHHLRFHTSSRLSQLYALVCARLRCTVCRSPAVPGGLHLIGECNCSILLEDLVSCARHAGQSWALLQGSAGGESLSIHDLPAGARQHSGGLLTRDSVPRQRGPHRHQQVSSLLCSPRHA